MNLKKLILLLLSGSLLFVKCDSPNGPINNEDIVPQIDIPWPSLGNTPWPMHHHDPQSTGRSKYNGPILGVIENKITLYGIEGGLSLDEENNILIADQYDKFLLHKFNISGNVIWEKQVGYTQCTPLIATDSTFYFISYETKKLYAFKYDGMIRWEYDTGNRCENIGINIGLDGTIYFVDDMYTLNAINKHGELLWQLTDSRFRIDPHGAPTFSPDGKYLYIQGTTVSVLAVNVQTHNIEWVFGEEGLRSSPVVDNQGNLYFIPNNYLHKDKTTLYSLSPHGSVNWAFNYGFHNQLDNTEPTIDYDGNIYFGYDTLYSVNHKGELRWKQNLISKIISALVSDKNCNIYVGTSGGGYPNPDPHTNYVIMFSKKGDILWKLEIADEQNLGASPAITNDGRLVFPTFRARDIIVIK